MINLNKSNQPKYLFKLNVALVIFLVWFVVSVAVTIIIGCIYGESMITYSVMVSMFAVVFIWFLVFRFVDKKLHNRFFNERAAELEKQFYEVPFEEAERILKERGIITDKGFVIEGDVFDKEVVPFEKVWFDLYYSLASANIDISVYKIDDSVKKIAQYSLDTALYNFLVNKDTCIKNNNIFNLLVNDKKEFAIHTLKFSETLRWDFSGKSHS